MKVLVDCRFAHTHTGLGRYTRELTAALLRRGDPLSYVLLARRQPDWLGGVAANVIVRDIPHYSFAEQRELPRLIASTGVDVFYSHHFNVPWFCPVPFVPTVHDLILHSYPDASPLLKRAAYRVLMHRAVRGAAAIVTVSAFVERELATTYGSAVLEKTVTAGEGVPPVFAPQPPERVRAVRAAYGCERPYFLYVGNCKEHKNVQTLIDAFAVSGADAELLLVTAPEEAARLRLLSGVRVLSGINDADLAALYSGANATVTASLYEGFGLPVLEALHCGSPVIAANRAAIPEVADGHALLVEPTVAAFAQAFLAPPPRPVLAKRAGWEAPAQRVALALSRLSARVTGRS